ncbi:hypothetical protein [Streptomyces sp. NPDC053560]|uniref:hypothetical protein n=1 Tax=Streptomyces sp. NPDC053560 TaxID=3365711 RepID=UPI0037CD48AE
MSPGLLTHLVREAREAACGGDHRWAADIVQRIADEGDALDVVAACRVFADTAVRALHVLYEPPDAAQDEMWALTDLGCADGCPHRMFAARLVTAHANQDSETVIALAAAAADACPADRAASLRELVTYAAGLEARAAGQKEGTDGQH